MPDTVPERQPAAADDPLARISRTKKVVFLVLAIAIPLLLVELGAAIVLRAVPDLRFLQHRKTFRFARQPEAEAMSRNDPYLFWRLRPDVVFPLDRSKPYHGRASNQYGLRCRPYEFEKPAGVVRVLCLGDSVTFGFGCDFDECYPMRLEAELNALEGTPRVQVINAGVSGYTSFQGLRYLESEGLRYQPDVVIAWFGFNDSSAWGGNTDFENAGVSDRGAMLRLLDHSNLFRLMGYLAARKARRKVFKGETPRVPAPDYERLLTQIALQVRARGAAPVLVVPVEDDQVGAKPGTAPASAPTHTLVYDDYGRAVLRVGRMLRAPVVDMPRLLRRHWRQVRFLDRCHPAPETHALIARELARFMRQRGLIPAPASQPGHEPRPK